MQQRRAFVNNWSYGGMFFNDCFSLLLKVFGLCSKSKAITDFSKTAGKRMYCSKSKPNISLAQSCTAFALERYITLMIFALCFSGCWWLAPCTDSLKHRLCSWGCSFPPNFSGYEFTASFSVSEGFGCLPWQSAEHVCIMKRCLHPNESLCAFQTGKRRKNCSAHHRVTADKAVAFPAKKMKIIISSGEWAKNRLSFWVCKEYF